MDLGSIIVGAILVAICISPIVLVVLSRKKRERKFLKSLNELAKKEGCIVNQFEICGDFIMGINEAQKKLFFFKEKENNTIIEQSINLEEIQNCTFNKVTKKGTSQYIINKVELAFVSSDKKNKDITLELFNADVNTQLDGELQFVEKWSKLINDSLLIKK